jgi:hypothetical protein
MMFEEPGTEPRADEKKVLKGDIEIAGVDDCRTIAVIGNKVRFGSAMNVGLPFIVLEWPLPRGGRIVRDGLSPNGPSALTEDGTLWRGRLDRSGWDRVGNLRDPVTSR